MLNPIFEKQTGYRVKTIAAGTGQSLAMGEKGEADVLLGHAPEAEKKLVDAGVVTNYQLVMHNDFVIVGAGCRPTGIKGKPSADAFKAIAPKEAPLFPAEMIPAPTRKNSPSGRKPNNPGRRQVVPGIRAGNGSNLTHGFRKTGIHPPRPRDAASRKENITLEILSEGDGALLNIYHVMEVNPEKFTKVNAAGTKAYVEFLISPEIQKMIGEFGKDKYGQPLFFPDAGKKVEELG